MSKYIGITNNGPYTRGKCNKENYNNKKKVSQVKMCSTLNDNVPGSFSSGLLKGISTKSKLWPPGTELKIRFMESPESMANTYDQSENDDGTFSGPERDENGNLIYYDPLEKILFNTPPTGIPGAIMRIVKERFAGLVSIKFNFVFSGDAHIRISFQETGCWSKVGKNDLTDISVAPGKGNRTPTMNFEWFDVATVLHEFCHALGLHHEHGSPYKPIPIKWNEKALFAWVRDQYPTMSDKEIYNNYGEIFTEADGTAYDPDSIMVYFFPNSVTLNNTGTKQNLRFSKIDVIYLNYLYPSVANFPTVPPDNYYYIVYGEHISDTFKNNVLSNLHKGKV